MILVGIRITGYWISNHKIQLPISNIAAHRHILSPQWHTHTIHNFGRGGNLMVLFVLYRIYLVTSYFCNNWTTLDYYLDDNIMQMRFIYMYVVCRLWSVCNVIWLSSIVFRYNTRVFPLSLAKFIFDSHIVSVMCQFFFCSPGFVLSHSFSVFIYSFRPFFTIKFSNNPLCMLARALCQCTPNIQWISIYEWIHRKHSFNCMAMVCLINFIVWIDIEKRMKWMFSVGIDIIPMFSVAIPIAFHLIVTTRRTTQLYQFWIGICKVMI